MGIHVLGMNPDPAYIDILLLLLVANGVPILADCVCRHRLTFPVDGGLTLLDGMPLFGRSKTIRGLVASIIATTFVAVGLGYSAATGFSFGSLAMVGDLLSSFVKRRCGWPSTSRALLLDQVPESLIPTALMASQFKLSAEGIAMLVAVFLLLANVITRLMHMIGVRKQPH